MKTQAIFFSTIVCTGIIKYLGSFIKADHDGLVYELISLRLPVIMA